MSKEEIWKDLIYQGKNYGEWLEISNNGDIRKKKSNKILKKTIGTTGYYNISTTMGSKKSRKTFKIHKALMETFIPNPEKFPCINHIDGNKLNNSFNNMVWCTYAENLKHALDTGLRSIANPYSKRQSKLTKEDVLFIRTNYIPRDKEYGTRGLGNMFNISHQCISLVLRNKTYKSTYEKGEK